jgi:serine/threonine protein kinase
MVNVRRLSGQMIGNYELRDLYGAGGMGAVYRAYQRNLEREVAFKIIATQFAEDDEFIKRFAREAKLSASLEHPNIVPVYDFGAYHGMNFVVMRLLTGGTLAERVRVKQGQLPTLGEVAILLKQVAGALDYAHSQRIIHRDIKPTNVMFDHLGTAYLVDFGIARLLQSKQTQLTQEGAAVGTPSYMAPEQWMGNATSGAADQYALAVMIYELIAGRLPFLADSAYTLMTKHTQEPPPPPKLFNPNLPDTITPVLMKALSKDAALRYPTVKAFAQAFEEATARYAGQTSGFFTTPINRQGFVTDVRRDLLNDNFNQTPQPPDMTEQRPRPQAAKPVAQRPPNAQTVKKIVPPGSQPPQKSRAPQPINTVPIPPTMPPQPVIVKVEAPKAKNASGSNPALMGLGIVGWVLGKILGSVTWLVKVVLAQAIRSVVSLVMALFLGGILAILIGGFTINMFQNDFNAGSSLALLQQQITDFLAGIIPGLIQQQAEQIQATLMPPQQ